MEYQSVRVVDIIKQVNRDVYLPAIQREFVWSAGKIERLFDSIMSDFPIGSFLYWRVDQENKNDWPIYEFIRNYDGEDPHNETANMAGVTRDITLVLDGQQRITSLNIGLKGSYRYFYYRWRTTRLYLDLAKIPVANDENPEELTYGFSFRENDEASNNKLEIWYLVGSILDFADAEDAKASIKNKIDGLDEKIKDNANRLIGRLHNRIHTNAIGNYYTEKSQDYDKVLQVFVRANSGGQPLEYSDLLLATATAKWDTLNAREEIHQFTDSLNEIGNGYGFGKDFVLKSCLYLSNLPIQYKVKNFTRTNLLCIEGNWSRIKESLFLTVKLISRFGFNSKNVVAPLALLPIAYFLMKRGNKNFADSSSADDVAVQVEIRRWFVFVTMKNAFGGSSDTILSRLREVMSAVDSTNQFPSVNLYDSLQITPGFTDGEIGRILSYGYQGRYTNLVLSLIYPNRDWKDAVYHEDHVFPQSEFKKGLLQARGFDPEKVQTYLDTFNLLPNLQLLTESENTSKSNTDFDEWLQTRDSGFKQRHLIPMEVGYEFAEFNKFFVSRSTLISDRLRSI
jgi:hypothetical protein